MADDVDLTERLVTLWAEQLGGQADADTNFVRASGNSLRAAVLVSRLRAEFGVSLTIREFLEAPTPSGMASVLMTRAVATEPHPDEVTDVLGTAVREGRVLGAQVYASRGERVLLDLAVGEVEPGMPMTRSSRLWWLCASKPITALACALVVDAGELSWHEPLALRIGELEGRPIGSVTPAQLLMNLSGVAEQVPIVPTAEGVAELKLRHDPGTVAAYSFYTGWQILRVLLERVTGAKFEHFVRQRLLEPLGMSETTMLQPSGHSNLAVQSLWENGGWRHVHTEDVTRLPSCEVDPARGFHGSARDLAKIYEEIRSALAGNGKILTASTAAQLVRTRRGRIFDTVIDGPADMGLGLQMHLSDYLLVKTCSSDAFGQVGAIDAPIAVGVCDPRTDTVIVVLLNGDAPDNHPLIADVIDRINGS